MEENIKEIEKKRDELDKEKEYKGTKKSMLASAIKLKIKVQPFI